ncbi:hypothetical protein GF420_12880 [candidate division GN15 bacterium]|nr:hypothetical protein [candidate division GN15 bacterium]
MKHLILVLVLALAACGGEQPERPDRELAHDPVIEKNATLDRHDARAALTAALDNTGQADLIVLLPGDINLDGDLDITDLVGLGTRVAVDMNSDVDQDGDVDVDDVLALRRMLYGVK